MTRIARFLPPLVAVAVSGCASLPSGDSSAVEQISRDFTGGIACATGNPDSMCYRAVTGNPASCVCLSQDQLKATTSY